MFYKILYLSTYPYFTLHSFILYNLIIPSPSPDKCVELIEGITLYTIFDYRITECHFYICIRIMFKIRMLKDALEGYT